MDESPANLQAQTHKLSLEERLAPKLDQGEYLLVLVLALMLWIAGFVDLFTHTSKTQAVLGLYSWPFFIFLILYSLGFVFWGALIFPPNSITWFKRGINFIQTHTLVGLAWFAGAAAVLFSMFMWDRWLSYPLLEASMAILIMMMSAVILITRPFPEEPVHLWRKVVGVLIAGLILVEVSLQLLSFVRILPFPNYNGIFLNNGRVYQSEEGYTNTTVNQFGWYYPDFRQEPGSQTIVFTGDSLVQGLQTGKDQLFGVLLDQKLNQSQETSETEVISMGLPGYGPGLYLNLPLYDFMIDPLEPSEVVVFFHLANDFQTVTSPGQEIPYLVVMDDGKIDVPQEDQILRHDIQHLIIRGYDPPNPVRTVTSHMFLYAPVERLIERISGNLSHVRSITLNFDNPRPDQPLGDASFMFSTQADPRAEAAWEVALGLLTEFQEHTAERGVTMRLVTIPHFPAEFFAADAPLGWDRQLGEYDLFLPEERLGAFAEERGLSFLGLGEYMQASGLSKEEVQELYLRDGTGHFSPEGHAFVSQALLDCFYDGPDACPPLEP